MKLKKSLLLAAVFAGVSALAAAQEPMRSPTANPMPRPTAAPAPTAARGVSPNSGGAYGPRNTPSVPGPQVTPAPTPRS